MRIAAALCVGLACFLVAGLPRGRTRGLFAPRRAGVRAGRGGQRRIWLQQAGATLTPAQFAAGSMLVGVLAFLVLAVLTGAPAVALVPSVALALLPRAYFARRRQRRLREVQEAWPDGLRDVLSSVAAGRSVRHAVAELAESGPAALRVAFARFPVRSRMLGTVPALELVKEELADPASDRVLEVLVLAHERGGRIVTEILEDLIVATTRDLKASEEIASESLEMKINARAVLVLPWLVLVMLTVRAGAFRDFYQTRAGVWVVVLGAVLSAVGAALIGRLARERAERRVFT